MKKRVLKKLQMNKKTISNLEIVKINGGTECTTDLANTASIVVATVAASVGCYKRSVDDVCFFTDTMITCP